MGPGYPVCWGVLCLGLCSPWARCKRGRPRQACPMLTSHLLSFCSPGKDTNSRSDGHCWHQRILVQAHPQPRYRPDQVLLVPFSANYVKINSFQQTDNLFCPHTAKWRLFLFRCIAIDKLFCSDASRPFSLAAFLSGSGGSMLSTTPGNLQQMIIYLSYHIPGNIQQMILIIYPNSKAKSQQLGVFFPSSSLMVNFPHLFAETNCPDCCQHYRHHLQYLLSIYWWDTHSVDIHCIDRYVF